MLILFINIDIDIAMNIDRKRRRLSSSEFTMTVALPGDTGTDRIPEIAQLVNMGYDNPRDCLKMINYFEETRVRIEEMEEIRRAFAMVSEYDLHARDENGWSLLHYVCSDIDIDEMTRLNLARVLVKYFWFDPKNPVDQNPDDAFDFCETHGHDALKAELEWFY